MVNNKRRPTKPSYNSPNQPEFAPGKYGNIVKWVTDLTLGARFTQKMYESGKLDRYYFYSGRCYICSACSCFTITTLYTMINRTYLVIKRISHIIIGLVFITLIVDIFFADDFGFSNSKSFIYIEGVVFGLFILFEILKWHYKKVDE